MLAGLSFFKVAVTSFLTQIKGNVVEGKEIIALMQKEKKVPLLVKS